METQGGCFCGAIAYRAEVDENRIGICHCRDCQIFSGSAFRTSAIVDPGTFVLTQGEPRHFDKTAASGRVRRMLFCGGCGSHIASVPVDPAEEGAFVSLRVATSKDFHRMRPIGELWCSSRVPWLRKFDDTVEFDGQP